MMDMLTKNRNKADIVARILKAANGNWVIKTKILYDAFLSYSQIKEYIPLLIESDLLQFRPDTQTYKTTEKGLRFLKLYRSIDQLVQ